jgi:hypothetical protein
LVPPLPLHENPAADSTPVGKIRSVVARIGVLEAAHRYIHQHRGGENPVPGGRRVRQSEKHVSVWEKPAG